MASSEISLEAVSSVSQIPADQWNACGNPTPRPLLNGHDKQTSSSLANDLGCYSTAPYNPFVSHAFFAALEKSDSACPRTGWGPRHLIARAGETVAGIVPCYLKSHSRGEYVF